MPRRPRIILPGAPVHVIQRGNNRDVCFYGEDDHSSYLGWLKEYARHSGRAIHAFVLMTNHVHILLTPKSEESAGDLMKSLGQRYVQYVNRTYRRSGTLWEGRFRSCLPAEDGYVLGWYRYIELNPVRARMVAHPGEHAWSSYQSNAQGEPSSLLTPHPLYAALGTDDERRQAAYRELFRPHFEAGLVDEIRLATKGSYALGSPRFQGQVAAALGRRASRGQSGRPRKRETWR